VSFIDWAIVLVLNAAIIGYGIVLARGTRTSGEWFLARRSLPWWAVGLSMFATNVDNADLVSMAGNAYAEGLHIITVHTLGTTIGVVIAAFFLVPAMYRAGFYTNAEYLEARFGVSARVLSALIQIQYRTSMLGLIIWAAHLLLMSPLVGIGAGASWTLIVLLVLLAALYTAWGGLRSVVWTDTAQGIVMLCAAAVILAAVWDAAGGWSAMTARLAGEGAAHLPHVGSYRGASGGTSPWVVALGWVLIGGGYWTVNHTQTMRLGGARSLWDMRMAALFGAVLSMPVMISCAVLGLFGRALFPELEEPDRIYPRLASLYLGPGFAGLVVAGIIAAAVSTFDSMGSALSALFTRDIYARLLVRDRDDAHYVRVSRAATVAITALSFLYLPFIASKAKMLDAFLTLIPVFVTPLFTLYLAGVFTRAHPRSGIVGLAAGSVYGVLALADREVQDLDWLPGWLSERWAALGWSLLVTAGAMAVTTAILGRVAGGAGAGVGAGALAPPGAAAPARGWLARSAEALPPEREHPFRARVPALLEPWIYAVVLLLGSAYLVFGFFW
jgi:SSS family solute:Na+ symporter